ncbi:hypothetical protein M422DRAFT_269853 [Sphaerobolus stellatus SS14]|uniref:Uncharacterized protein n=1 Tax=Sphaerobolus stellatus (strain SS14) TaxID=990650 RepID=A0A0C9U3M9_SPHS4|nr:hypothetical protein M422DRAFT_269853 [Sphaerobolus stellatus SS14]
MTPKKKTSDKVPAGTSPGKDPSQAASAALETDTICPTTWSTWVTDQLTQPITLIQANKSAEADTDPEKLVLGNQIQEMLDTTNKHMDEHNIDSELIQSTDGSNNISDPKQALGKAQAELLAKTAVLEQLYADQAPAGHLNQAAMAAQSTCMEYERLLRLSKAGLLNLKD